jgi:hypothetical protein
LIWAQLQAKENELTDMQQKVDAYQRDIDKNDQALEKVGCSPLTAR